MQELDEQTRAQLSSLSATRYEAETFIARHKEFFVTPANGKKISDYMQRQGMNFQDAQDYELAFAELKSRGELIPSREELANMGSGEYEEFIKAHGVPVTDGFGRVSYELPQDYLTAPTEDYNRPRMTRYTQNTLPAHPEDAKRKISKQEFLMMNPERAKEYLQMIGCWGKDLPEHLR